MSSPRLLIFFALLVAGVSGNPRFEMKKCPKGWFQFEKNCYIRQPDLLDFEGAVKSCERREATLFNVDNSFEFEAVKILFPDYYFTWVQAEVKEELVWLFEPYEQKINGKSVVLNATCIAFYSSPTVTNTIKGYNYYYPCTAHFHSICEKPLD